MGWFKRKMQQREHPSAVLDGMPWLVLVTETGDFYLLRSLNDANMFLDEFGDDIPQDFRIFDSRGHELTFSLDSRSVPDPLSASTGARMDPSIEDALSAFARKEGIAVDPADLLGSFIRQFPGYDE